MVRARPALPLLLILLACASGCGDGGGGRTGTSSGTSTPAPAPSGAHGSRSDRAVVQGWADALRGGRIARADAYFRLDALVSPGGGAPVHLRTRAEVHAFDLGLPCGARIVRTLAHEGYLLAEFRLTERGGPGGGSCDGPGGLAATAFRIVDGHIAEWRRITGLPGSGGHGSPAPQEAPPGAVPA